MWTPPISAPPTNPDTAQSALPTAAVGRQSVACRAAPARFAPAPARFAPGLARLERPKTFPATPRIKEPTTTGESHAACQIGPLRALRRLRKCLSFEPPPHLTYCLDAIPTPYGSSERAPREQTSAGAGGIPLLSAIRP